MRVTLLRHGPAADRETWSGDDAERPLTDAGMKLTNIMVNRVKPLIKAVEIWTSPWVRARQTAELASLAWKLPVRETAWLAGGAATNSERASRLHIHTDVVLVGHEPDLSGLVQFLCGASIELKKAGIVILRGIPHQGEMKLRGMFTAKQVQKIGSG